MKSKYTGASLLLAAIVLVWSGCAGTQTANMPGSSADAEAIDVLVVTATHGFRHGEAIAQARETLTDAEASTEFDFDFTEDLNDLNAQNLAQYDVLFFANSTLRGAADPSLPGSAGTWNISLTTPRGESEGVLLLSGSPGAYNGILRANNENMNLEDVVWEGDLITFSYPGFRDTRAMADLQLSGADLTGSVAMGNFNLAVKGARVGGVVPPGTVLVTDAQKAAIMGFLSAGKGIAVAHAGLDAFYDWPEYREMVGGGLFQEHPWTQEVRISVEDQDNPSTRHLGESFTIRDEIYVLDQNPRWNSRVLASLDMESVGIEQGPADATSNDYPISWIRRHNGGRVFVTKLGHFADVWTNPAYQQHLYQGLRMAAGTVDANFGGHRVKEVIADVWPDDIAVDERGNVWIAELQGKVHRYDAQTGQTTQIAQLNTTNPVNIEHGLYGIEVDPEFYNGQPYVYVYYAMPETFVNALWRYEYRNGQLDMSTGMLLLNVPTEPQCCHQAGDLEWGPDGTLYVSTGDTGMSEVRPDWENTEEEIQAFLDRNQLEDYHWSRLVDSERSAQNLTDLRGKILRINKDGSIPKDNPFFGEAGVRWEIYAYGLRNPYRFKVDDNGDVYIGIVGPDEAVTYDWYDISVEGGENFGWPRANGRLLYNEWKTEMIPNYVPPMWEYTYETGGRSATVGPIYRSDGEYAFPESFQNKVFLFDWARRWIKYADVEDGAWTNDTTASVKGYDYAVTIPAKRYTNIKTFDVLTETAPISMEMTPDGSIIVAEFAGFWGPAPGARVTRYRWVEDEDTPVVGASVISDSGSN